MPQPNKQSDFTRSFKLQTLQRWCLERISFLSLSGRDPDAQAITEEHLELLKGIENEPILWMTTEKELHEGS